MCIKRVCYVELSEIPCNVIEYLMVNGLVQHQITLLDIYKYPYIPNLYVVYKDNKVIGAYPLIIYKGRYGEVAYSLPYYSYGGYVGDNKVYEYALRDLKARGVYTLSNCLHPFYKYDGFTKEQNITHLNMDKFFQYIDFNDGHYLEQMNSKQRNNLKRNLKIANANNIVLKKSYDIKDLEFWYKEIYCPRMKETRGAIYPLSVYIHLMNLNSKNKVEFIIAQIDNKIIGAAFYLKQNKSYDLFMRVIGTEYLSTQAGILLDYTILEEAIKNGVRYFNWQSADEEGSPIFKYKATWGSKKGYYRYTTYILNDLKQFEEQCLSDLKSNYPAMYIAPYTYLIGITKE